MSDRCVKQEIKYTLLSKSIQIYELVNERVVILRVKNEINWGSNRKNAIMSERNSNKTLKK